MPWQTRGLGFCCFPVSLYTRIEAAMRTRGSVVAMARRLGGSLAGRANNGPVVVGARTPAPKGRQYLLTRSLIAGSILAKLFRRKIYAMTRQNVSTPRYRAGGWRGLRREEEWRERGSDADGIDCESGNGREVEEGAGFWTLRQI